MATTHQPPPQGQSQQPQQPFFNFGNQSRDHVGGEKGGIDEHEPQFELERDSHGREGLPQQQGTHSSHSHDQHELHYTHSREFNEPQYNDEPGYSQGEEQPRMPYDERGFLDREEPQHGHHGQYQLPQPQIQHDEERSFQERNSPSQHFKQPRPQPSFDLEAQTHRSHPQEQQQQQPQQQQPQHETSPMARLSEPAAHQKRSSISGSPVDHFSRPVMQQHHSQDNSHTYDSYDRKHSSSPSRNPFTQQQNQVQQQPSQQILGTSHSSNHAFELPAPTSPVVPQHFPSQQQQRDEEQSYNNNNNGNDHYSGDYSGDYSEHDAQQQQGSPVHNFSKPVAIPHTRSYDSSMSNSGVAPPQQQLSGSQTSPAMHFSQPQVSMSASYRSSSEHLPPAPPSLGNNTANNTNSSNVNLSSSYSSNHGDFFPPPHFNTDSPAAAPNQTPATTFPQPFLTKASSSGGGLGMLYSNHREAQPAQHTPVAPAPDATSFPAGWAREREASEGGGMPPPPLPPPPPQQQQQQQQQQQHQSTNPFSPLPQTSHPHQPPPLAATPPDSRNAMENMRSLQEGSTIEPATKSSRSFSNSSARSSSQTRELYEHQQHQQQHQQQSQQQGGAGGAGVIGRPTPPSQPSSQTSHHSTATRGGYVADTVSYTSQPSPPTSVSSYTNNNQSSSNNYSNTNPPAVPPKQPLEEPTSNAGRFSYQQHLQRHLANASTSPRGLAGYGPPPMPPGGHGTERGAQPRITSPLSFRERRVNDGSSGPGSPREDRKASLTGQSYHNHDTGSPTGSLNSQHSLSNNNNRKEQAQPQTRYSPQQQEYPEPPRSYDGYDEPSRELPHIDTALPPPNREFVLPPYLTPIDDGPAPPPAPSCPPSDTPISEMGPRGPPGAFLRNMNLNNVGGGSSGPPGYKSFTGMPLMGKRWRDDSRENGEGGTPAGFLGRSKGRGGIKPEFPPPGAPPPLGSRPRGQSGSSGLGKMERPGSAEGDDPIPPEYRPRKEVKSDEEGTKGTDREKPMQQLRRGQVQPPPLGGGAHKSPDKANFNMRSPPGGTGMQPPPVQSQQQQVQQQQRSPAEVGLGGYLYTKPIPVNASANSGTANPRFPGGHITSPLAHSTSPPGVNMASRESIMRGQWVDDTAAVSGPAPVRGAGTGANVANMPRRKPVGDERTPPQAQQPFYSPATYDAPQVSQVSPQASMPPPVSQASQQDAAYKAFTQPFQSRQDHHLTSPEAPMAPPSVEDVDEEGTNPSESPTPDIPAIPASLDSKARIPSQTFRGPAAGQESLFTAFQSMLPALPPTHIQSLLNFAVYLSEDATFAEKAEKVLMEHNGGSVEQLSLLADQRLRRWHEWTKIEEQERTRLAAFRKDETSPPAQNPFEDTNEDDSSHYDGMQPLPPPPKLPELDVDLSNPNAHFRPTSTFPTEPVIPQHHHHHHHHHHREQTPSPTPTLDQINAAPKVDLEIQMPRPMPSVPAIRIDPSARRRHNLDDDASTVVSEAHTTHSRQTSDMGGMDMGAPGGTPYPFPFPKRNTNIQFSASREIETQHLTQLISSFAKAKSSANNNGSGPSGEEELLADIPPFLHMAYAALDQATNTAPLDGYLSDARTMLEQKTQARLNTFNQESLQRRNRNQTHTAALYNTGRLTYADLERMREEFEAEEARRKMEVDKAVYLDFESSFVEVAYKDVKAHLEELGGRWYEEVKTWLFSVTSESSDGKTALEYHLLLEAIDLLNKLHATMEEHELVLQTLVSDRNARYLQVSVAPLLSMGETVRAADAERRYWIDEQERQIRGKMERGKRIADHRQAVDAVGERIVEGLKKRFGEVLDAVWSVVWQFPAEVQPVLLRKFFDEQTMPIPEGKGSGQSGSYTVPPETLKTLADAVGTLAEIVGLVKLALEFRSAPAVRAVEAGVALQVAEEVVRREGVMAPAAMAAAVGKGVKARLPGAVKRVTEDGSRMAEGVVGGLVEVLERLRIGVGELARGGGRVDVGARMEEAVTAWRGQWEPYQGQSQQGGGVGLGAGLSGGSYQQQQQPPASNRSQPPQQQQQQGGLSIATMLGGFRRTAGNTNSLLISPGAYSANGYSPAGLSAMSASGGPPWGSGQQQQQQQGQTSGAGGGNGSGGY